MSKHMRDEKKRWLLGAGLALGVGLGWGCLDFEGAYTDCVAKNNCPLEPGKCTSAYPDVPDDDFLDSNCDGIDGDAQRAIFVDPAAGSDDNRGTKEAPFKTLGAALRLGTVGWPIYLARGRYVEPPVTISRTVSIYGGYGGLAEDWVRKANYDARLVLTGHGLTVNPGGDAGVLLDSFLVDTSAPDAGGAPSVSLRVVDSQDVRLRNMRVFAGAGHEGDMAPQVAAAQAGQPGGTGQTAPNGSSNSAPGGDPGPNTCPDGPPALGKGGIGGSFDARADAGFASGPTVAGGDAGSFGCNNVDTCEYAFPGGAGQNGWAGDGGTVGPEGDGIGFVNGSGQWVANTGGPGSKGFPGLNGGGGGGGGRAGVSSFSNGGGGGGGGSGGCAGEGGGGGQGGGASIAVLLINSNVSLVATTVSASTGGRGGMGALGGRGGAGGPGGDGGTRSFSTEGADGGLGGPGGAGGAGGTGGNGGGGGGGPSVGIWCQGSSTVTLGTNTLLAAGEPGASGARAPINGNPGLKAEQYQCPARP